MNEFSRLRQSIEDAFKDVPHPGTRGLIRGETLEAQDTAEFFGKYVWHSISINQLKVNQYAPYFMSVQGNRYFLPAFMLATIANLPATDAISNILVKLFTPGGIYNKEEFAHFIRGFTAEQLDAILAYFFWLSQNDSDMQDDPDMAMEISEAIEAISKERNR